MTSSVTRPTRRTLVKGAAWSVPVIAVAGAAPAFAASGSVTLTQTGACKSPGNSCKSFPKGYKFTFNAVNTWPCEVTITSATISVTSGEAPGTLTVVTPFTVPAGTTPAFVVTVLASNSANRVFTAQLCYTYTVSCRETDAITECTTVNVTGTPPDCECPAG